MGWPIRPLHKVSTRLEEEGIKLHDSSIGDDGDDYRASLTIRRARLMIEASEALALAVERLEQEAALDEEMKCA